MLTVEDNGLTLSTGLLSRIIATTGQKVKNSNGNESNQKDPDSTGLCSVKNGPNKGGWVYASNAETSRGEVGAITFNSDGEVINYEMVVTDTSNNCGGCRIY